MGGTSNFLNLTFPVKHFGKLYGFTRLSGGLMTFLSVPIFNYVQSLGNRFEYANYGYCVALRKFNQRILWNISCTSVITFLHPLNVYRVSRDRERNQVSESLLK